jgi:hypothetical protein
MCISRFAQLPREEKEKIKIADLTVSEIKFVIEETVFAKEVDPLIAEMRFIRSLSMEKIADKIGYEQRRSVQLRLEDITERLQKTILKLI